MKLEHKSLDRGITIMEVLGRNGSCTLAELHRLSGISKSSIRRLLATLVQRRLVRRSLADGRYRMSMTMPVGAGVPVPADLAFAVDVALPHVTALTTEIGWPSDIHVLDGDRMRVLDSTRPLSPFHLYRGVVDQSVNIFGSASGMSCLAAMPDTTFERIAVHTAGDTSWGLSRFRLTIEQYREHLNATRERGYGTRVARFVGHTVFDDGLAAIAIPIFSHDRIYGAVSLLWPKNYLEPEKFAGQYLGALKRTTELISVDLERFEPFAGASGGRLPPDNPRQLCFTGTRMRNRRMHVLDRFGPGIWIANGPEVVAMAGFHYPTRMAVIGLSGGRLFVWSPVPLTPDLREQVDSLGRVSHLVAPNFLHHLFLPEWKQAYPDARIHAPPGLRAKRPDIAFDADLAGNPDPEWAGEIDQVVVNGNRIATEIVFFHDESRTVLFADLIQQFPEGWFSGWRAVVAKLDRMTGAEPSVPRKFRLAFTDRAAARASLQRILEWPADKVLMAHGQPVESDGRACLRRAFAWLRV